MSDSVTPPNTERKKAENGVTRCLKWLLRNRRTFMLAMQVLSGTVKLMRTLKDWFGGP